MLNIMLAIQIAHIRVIGVPRAPVSPLQRQAMGISPSSHGILSWESSSRPVTGVLQSIVTKKGDLFHQEVSHVVLSCFFRTT